MLICLKLKLRGSRSAVHFPLGSSPKKFSFSGGLLLRKRGLQLVLRVLPECQEFHDDAHCVRVHCFLGDDHCADHAGPGVTEHTGKGKNYTMCSLRYSKESPKSVNPLVAIQM